MPIRRSVRLADLVQSDIRAMTRECERVGGINLGQGLCQLPTPGPVREGALRAIRQGLASYSPAEGLRELRGAIAHKLRARNGIEVDPDAGVVVTAGASGAYACTLHALLDPGDGILLFEPFYGYHLNAALLAGLRPRFLPLRPPDFAVDERALEGAIDAGTRAVVVCTPANPSGKVWSRAELEALARVANARDLLVITDEIYEDIVYEGARHVSPASLSGLFERTVTISGLSKTFSVTGWRLGYAAGPPALVRSLTVVNDLFYICAPTPLQHGAAAGFSLGEEFYADLRAGYARKRAWLCEALSDAGMNPIPPQGAYYVLADVSHWGYSDARSAAMALLEGARVAAVPGSAFHSGRDGEGLLRLCYALEEEPLREACERIRRFRPGRGGHGTPRG